MAELARSPEWMLRDMVARHRRAPRRLLTRLAKDCEPIRQSTARNPRTPKRTLSALAADPERHVRIAAASNEAIPQTYWQPFYRTATNACATKPPTTPKRAPWQPTRHAGAVNSTNPRIGLAHDRHRQL